MDERGDIVHETSAVDAASSAPTVTCPTCNGRAPWHGNPHRPFCGLVCRLIDLGAWLDERYRVPSKDASDDVS